MRISSPGLSRRPRGASVARRRVIPLVLILAVWSGCAKGHGSSSTGPTALDTTQDFGSNNPSVYTALGDSITLGVETVGGRAIVTPRSYPAVLQDRVHGIDAGTRVINRGIGGETIEGGLARINGVLAVDHPGFILILEGTNSLGDMPLVADIREMVRRAKANKTVPLVGTIPPQFGGLESKNALIASTNAQIIAMGHQEGITVVDIYGALFDPRFFSEDGFHPNDEGYRVMAEAWFGAILGVR